ncbi:MAG TPA: alpha-E domain-containing protein [Acidimicrobiales bacterium]
MSKGMLSRLAELIYWTGRYVERADDTSRIVDAYIHRISEDPFGDRAVACQSLFAILGMEIDEGTPMTEASVLKRIVFDRESPSAITGAVLAAHENARRAREVISSEMWVCLNATRNDLAQEEEKADRVGPASYLQFIRERSALFAGLTDATISHDETWWYLVLGRSLERIDMTARLLEGRLLAAEHSPDWLTLLRAAGAMESYLRMSIRGADPEAIANFLLLDRSFPRSAYHSLAVADNCLEELTKASTHLDVVSQARRTIRMTQTRLEYMDSRTLLGDLADVLQLLEDTSAAANDQITANYFRQAVAISWDSEEGT